MFGAQGADNQIEILHEVEFLQKIHGAVFIPRTDDDHRILTLEPRQHFLHAGDDQKLAPFPFAMAIDEIDQGDGRSIHADRVAQTQQGVAR